MVPPFQNRDRKEAAADHSRSLTVAVLKGLGPLYSPSTLTTSIAVLPKTRAAGKNGVSDCTSRQL